MFLFKFDTTFDPICGGEVKRIEGRKIFPDHNFKHVIKLSNFFIEFQPNFDRKKLSIFEQPQLREK